MKNLLLISLVAGLVTGCVIVSEAQPKKMNIGMATTALNVNGLSNVIKEYNVDCDDFQRLRIYDVETKKYYLICSENKKSKEFF
jgi:hypothetical protein